MFPSLLCHNQPYSVVLNAIFFSKVSSASFSWCVRFSYFINLFVGEFCLSRSFSMRNKLPSFFNAIQRIVFSCSKPKMFRVYAVSYIARMENAKFTWNQAITEKPRHPMGRFFFAWPTAIICCSISGWINRTFPIPAIFGFFNIFKKSISDRNSFPWIQMFPHGSILAHGGLNG